MKFWSQMKQYDEEKEAIRMNDQVLTYGDLQALQEVEVYRNRVIAISTKSVFQTIKGIVTIIKSGGIIAPMNPEWTEQQKQVFLEKVRPHFLIHTNGVTILHEENESLQNMFLVTSTSGSTGKARCIARTEESWIRGFYAYEKAFQLPKGHRILVVGSMYHSIHLCATLGTLYLGGTVQLIDSFVPSKVVETIKKESNLHIFLVPTMLKSILSACEEVSEEKVVMISAGSALTRSDIENFYSKFPIGLLHEYYGAAETSFISFIYDVRSKQKDSIGKPFEKVKVLIRNNELFVWSEFLATGYVENGMLIPFQESHISVGDLVYKDGEGILYFKGRSKGKVKIGGVTVFIQEVENELYSCKACKNIILLTEKEEHFGERIIAYCELNQGFTMKDVRKYAKEKLTKYQLPKKWIEVEEIPLLWNGKIDREKLSMKKGF